MKKFFLFYEEFLSSLEYEVQQNCNLTQIGGVLGSKGYGIALRKSKFLKFLFYSKYCRIRMDRSIFTPNTFISKKRNY